VVRYGLALLSLIGVLISSHLTGREVRGGVPEEYTLPKRMYLLFVPRDLHYGISDAGFINTLAFIGSLVERNRGVVDRENGLRIYEAISAVVFYNPKYFDPYYVANAFLNWEAKLYKEAIEILKWGLNHVDDWRIPFYIGFNYFYFLGDNLEGARYLKMAAEDPRAKEYNLIPLLASRLYYEEGRLRVALALLEEQLERMKLESMKKAIRARMETLKKALLIEEAMKIFRRRHGRLPLSIEELEEAGLIPPNMRDHAGGKFYLTADGKVRSEKVLFPIRRKLLEEEGEKASP